MSKWRKWEDDEYSDRLEKTTKMRRKKSKPKFSDKQSDFELVEESWNIDGSEAYFAARVVEVHKKYAFVSKEPVQGTIDTRDVWLATVARKFLTEQRGERNFVVVGDRVLCRPAREGEVPDTTVDLPQCLIECRTPRSSQISRVDPSHQHREHLLASNVDQILVVASFLSPKVRWGLVDRCLLMAELNRSRAILVLNKKDLLDDCDDDQFKEESAQRIANYRKIGYQVFEVCLNNIRLDKNKDLTKLRDQFKNRISMVVGHSGVGKSTLVNHFYPEIEQHVEENSDIFYKGRHTTSFASLIKLGTGGYLIDTPGVRSFSVGKIDAISLTSGFREFRPYLGRCKFRECRHIDEPQCAVQEAVALGDISTWRYQSFRGILEMETGREGKSSILDMEE